MVYSFTSLDHNESIRLPPGCPGLAPELELPNNIYMVSICYMLASVMQVYPIWGWGEGGVQTQVINHMIS